MQSKQLLSIVFSLIMFTGVTAGNAVFAQSDDVDISESVEIEITIDDVTKEEHDDEYDDDRDEEYDNREDSKREYHDNKNEKYDDLDDRLESFCKMTEDEKKALFVEHPKFLEFEDRLSNFCSLETEDKREDAIEAFIKEHIPEIRDHVDYELDDLLDRFCAVTDEDKRKLFLDFPRLAQFSDRLVNYCEMSEDEQDAIEDLLENYKDEINSNIREHITEFKMNSDKDMREYMDNYCEMSDEDKKLFLTKHDKVEDHAEKMNQYCESNEDEKIAFIEANIEEHKEHMKKMMKEKHHSLDYEKLCLLSESELATEITDLEKLDKITSWCGMTPEEQEDYMMKHHDNMSNKMHDKISCECHKGEDGTMSCPMMDRESDMQCSMMDMKHEKMKFSDKSERLKTMIMSKHDISDERHEEIKMKYIEKHGELTDDQKSNLKTKFKEHMVSKGINMSEERRSEIQDRVAEMKAFKAELRENSSEITDEQKQQLREEFIEKAKNMQLAWISPRHQMNAGIFADEIECREGFSLVMKASNGVPMCLKSDTALKMIDKGIAVPAN